MEKTLDSFVIKRKSSVSKKDEEDKKEEISEHPDTKKTPKKVEEKAQKEKNNSKFFDTYEDFIDELGSWKEPLKTFINPPGNNTMKFIYGHCSEDINDFDSIAYDVSNIRLIVLKKYKELNDCNFCISVWIMRQMHFRLPKFVLKRYNRKLKAIKNTIDEKLYLSTIKDYFSE